MIHGVGLPIVGSASGNPSSVALIVRRIGHKHTEPEINTTAAAAPAAVDRDGKTSPLPITAATPHPAMTIPRSRVTHPNPR